MKNKHFVYLFSLMALASCKVPMAVSEVKTQRNISVGESIAEDATFVKTIIPYKKSLEQQMNEKISHTAVELNKTGMNSNLGNLLADYTYDVAKDWAAKNGIPSVDAAVINIGGIRSVIGQGDIALKHIFEVMPFENEIVIVEMKGTDIGDLFQYYLRTQKNNPVSRLVIETENKQLTKTLIGGDNIDPNRTYYIATSDYLALGGDNMKFFSKGKMIATGLKLRDAFVEKFKQNPEVVAPTDMRLNFK